MKRIKNKRTWKEAKADIFLKQQQQKHKNWLRYLNLFRKEAEGKDGKELRAVIDRFNADSLEVQYGPHQEITGLNLYKEWNLKYKNLKQFKHYYPEFDDKYIGKCYFYDIYTLKSYLITGIVFGEGDDYYMCRDEQNRINYCMFNSIYLIIDKKGKILYSNLTEEQWKKLKSQVQRA